MWNVERLCSKKTHACFVILGLIALEFLKAKNEKI